MKICVDMCLDVIEITYQNGKQKITYGYPKKDFWPKFPTYMEGSIFFLLNPFGIVVCCNLFLGPRTKKGENIKKNQSKNIAGKEDATAPRK